LQPLSTAHSLLLSPLVKVSIVLNKEMRSSNLPSSRRTAALHVRTTQADLRATCAVCAIYGSFCADFARGKSNAARAMRQREVDFRSHRRLATGHCSDRNGQQRKFCDYDRFYGYSGGIAVDLAADIGTNRGYGRGISEGGWCVKRNRRQCHCAWRFA
jgi:hypothetical protein